MHSGRIVFAQVMDVLPMHEFRKCVRRYEGERRVRTFSCLDQFLCMAFAQLTYRESLRDVETCLRAVSGKLYNAGIRGRISHSTMADANGTRDWRIDADFAQKVDWQVERVNNNHIYKSPCSTTHHGTRVAVGITNST